MTLSCSALQIYSLCLHLNDVFNQTSTDFHQYRHLTASTIRGCGWSKHFIRKEDDKVFWAGRDSRCVQRAQGIISSPCLQTTLWDLKCDNINWLITNSTCNPHQSLPLFGVVMEPRLGGRLSELASSGSWGKSCYDVLYKSLYMSQMLYSCGNE